MTRYSPEQPSIRPPHPLARALIERVAPRATVLEIGSGSGRNTAAMTAAGLVVAPLEDAPVADAALSTHALLHGELDEIAALLAAIAARLRGGAPLFATFGSVNDARFGSGVHLGGATYAPLAGDEAGIAHTYFTRESLRALLEPNWVIESMDEHRVDDIAGSWAHTHQPLRGAYHWFVIARHPSPSSPSSPSRASG